MRSRPAWFLAALFGVGAALAADAEPTIDFMLRPGDTLIGVSPSMFGSPNGWREVAALNRLPNPNRIKPGQVLRVPERLLRSQPAPATLVSVEGEVSIDQVVSLRGALLREGQAIQTGERSSAVIELADGSRLKLPPSSLAEVMSSRVYGARGDGAAPAAPSSGLFSGALRLLRGSVEVFASKVLRARPLELTTPTAVIGVRGTQYRVGVGEAAGEGGASSSRSEVIEGKVQVDLRTAGTAPVGVLLPGGFGTRADAGSTALQAVPLLPAPDLSGVPARFERPVVRFTLPGSDALRVQVAPDENFDRMLSDQRVAAGEEVRIADLPDGNWFVRARRLDAKDIEGFDAQRAFVLKARPEPPPVSTPPPRAKQTVGSVDFSWAAAVQRLRYRLQIARDAGFSDLLLDRSDIDTTALRVDMANAGLYHWRVASIAAGNDQGPFADAQRFELREMPTPPQGGLSADGRSVTLYWSGRPEDRQQVELASDEAFTDIVARDELSEPRWAPAAPARPGTYYFRYRSVEADGFTSPYSPTLKIEVPFDKRVLLLLVPLLFFGL